MLGTLVLQPPPPPARSPKGWLWHTISIFHESGAARHGCWAPQTRTCNPDDVTSVWEAIDAIKRQKRLAADAPGNVWAPIPETRFFSRNGDGVYERLTDKLFLRVDKVG